MKTRKVVIIGAGHVGSHVALGLIQSGEADDIVLIDILKEKAAAQALDLDDCVSGALCGHDAVIRAGEYDELNDADIMVVAFGRSRKPGETRLDMFDDTIRMANEVIGHLKQVDFKGIMISISNPADIICEYIRRQMNWQTNRCFCTGTSLETYRLLRVLTAAAPFRQYVWANTATAALSYGRAYLLTAPRFCRCAKITQGLPHLTLMICRNRLNALVILKLTARAAPNLALPMLP